MVVVGGGRRREGTGNTEGFFLSICNLGKKGVDWTTKKEIDLVEIWTYNSTEHGSWETYMQVRKQQFELDMEQQIDSK